MIFYLVAIHYNYTLTSNLLIVYYAVGLLLKNLKGNRFMFGASILFSTMYHGS